MNLVIVKSYSVQGTQEGFQVLWVPRTSVVWTPHLSLLLDTEFHIPRHSFDSSNTSTVGLGMVGCFALEGSH